MHSTPSTSLTAQVTFRALGPLEASVDNEPVDGGGPKQRAVLARLLLHPGRIVAVDQLTDAVWDHDPPGRPEVSIRSMVSNWRKLLEPNRPRNTPPAVVCTSPPGYRLDIRPRQLDITRFERCQADGRDLLRAGEPMAAAKMLREGLEEWRGDAFTGLTSMVFEGHRARLGELRLTTEDLLAEASLAAGDHATATVELERLMVEEPTREHRHRLAMLSLYRAGRQADALAVFQNLRSELVEQLGIDPQPATADLERRILNHDPELEHGSAARLAEHIEVAAPSPEPSIAAPAGRAQEADALLTLSNNAAAGKGGAALITGEPGIGKTTLLRFAAQTAAPNATVAWGRAVAGGASSVLNPWRQILRDCCEGASADDISAWTNGSVELGLLLPELSEGATEASADDRVSLFDAVTRFLRRRSATAPLYLLFEDLHWADPSTIELIAFAGAALTDAPVVFLATWRDTELEHAPVGALQDLGRLPEIVRLELAGITADAVGDLIEALDISEVDVDVAATLHQRTLGNPLFVTELMGLWRHEPTSNVSELPVTTGIRDAIRRRVSGVGALAVDSLAVLALVDTHAAIPLISRVCGHRPNKVRDALARSVQAGLAVENDDFPDHFALHHALVGETLAEDLPGFQRCQMHAEIGQALWEQGAPAHKLALHFAAGAPAGTGALAATFAIEASAAADALFDLPQALALLETGLDALQYDEQGDLGLESDLLVGISQIKKQSGEYLEVHDYAQRAFDAARRQGDINRMAVAAMSYTGRSAEGAMFDRVEWLGYWHPPEPAVAMLEACEAKMPADNSHRIGVLSMLGSSRFGSMADPGRSRRELRQAIQLGRELRQPQLVEALFSLREQACRYGSPAEQHALNDEALELAVAWRSTNDVVQAHRIRSVLAADVRDGLSVVAHIDAAEAAAEDANEDLARLQACWTRAAWHLLQGDLGAADQLIGGGMVEYARYGTTTLDALGLQYAGLQRLRGGFAEVEELLAYKLTTYDGAAFASALAMNLAEQGKTAAAREILDRYDDQWTEPGEAALQFQTQANFALAATLTGHRRAAEDLHSVFAQLPSRLVVLNAGMLYFCTTSFYAGITALIVGEHHAALRHLEEAERFDREIGSIPNLIHTLVAQSRLAATVGDQETQSAKTAEASELAATHNIGWLEAAAPAWANVAP